MQIAKFPFKKIGKEYLGIIWRPYTVISVQGKNGKWYSLEMVIDTGADYTLLPKRYAQLLEIDLGTECFPQTTLGVGGSETVYLYKSLPVRLNNWERKIPVGFLERDDVPALLGRLEFIEILRVVFDKHQVIFED